MKKYLDMTYIQQGEYLASIGEKPYRNDQIITNLYKNKQFSEISNLSNKLKQILEDSFTPTGVSIYKEFESKIDETKKFLFKLSDNELIESVLMKYHHGYTVCISTQVGCRMGCSFCASGKHGLIRDLTLAELLAQVIIINSKIITDKNKRGISNIVLMGSGEPLDNYTNVVNFINEISSKNGLEISKRNISLSTVGVVEKINQLEKLNIPINLTISLHAPNDKKRMEIIQTGKKYKVQDIIKACKSYQSSIKRRIYFEYIMLEDFNDTMDDAKQLSYILKDLNCHVNLIRFNYIDDSRYLPTSKKRAYAFCDYLNKNNISATLRRTLGSDIEGACGQLKLKTLESENAS